MTDLRIRQLTLYKHGLGAYARQGALSGDSVRLSFARQAMNDVLKSLTAYVDAAPGAVLGLNFESQPDRNAQMRRPRPQLGAQTGVFDYLQTLRGRMIKVECADINRSSSEAPAATVYQGELLALQYGINKSKDTDSHQRRACLLLKLAASSRVQVLELDAIRALELLESESESELAHLLRSVQARDERESATLLLKPGHDGKTLHVRYIAPAPAWRVSYRLLIQELSSETNIILQGFGVFDNTLDEDLENVQLTLMAGMPVSFQYLLHEPNTPARAVVEDEKRSVDAPVQFAAALREEATQMPSRSRTMAKMAAAPMLESSFMDAAADAIDVEHVGENVGALFAYRIGDTVSVKRGNSAMVPLINAKLKGRRELLYNEAKHARNPIASVRFQNQSGYTLERGPLTVFDGDDYAGEAVLAVTQQNKEVIVAYAVELGVEISRDERHEHRTVSIELNQGEIYQSDFHFRITRYHANSSLSTAATVTVEHARTVHYELMPSKVPSHSVDPRTTRFELEIAAFAKAELEVIERFQQRTHMSLDSYTASQLEQLLSGVNVDAAHAKKLRAAFAIREQLAPLHQRLQQIAQEKQAFIQQQQRTRDNLSALKDSSAELKLRARFVSELERDEDRIQALLQEEQKLNALKAATEQRSRDVLNE
jgi:hypothetical protein